jgi:glycosyltransferase involved in cell wall biosynthesis
MKRIVILSAFLSPMRSGAEACAEEVPLALADQFYFTIVTARMRKELPKKDLLQGKIPVIRVGLGCTFDKWLFPFLAPLAVAKIKPDVVHAVLETFAGLALVFCKAQKKILTCQTTNRSFLKGFIVKKADHVTAISTALIDIVQQYRSDPITKIPNGIHVQDFEEARKNTKKVRGRILFVGRLEQQKGVDTLLKAFAQVEGDAHLRIVGDGSQKKLLLKITTTLGISDRVEFLGYIPAERIADEYAAAEIFCGLSRSEALGNVFLEAQAAGCAIVATGIGGIVDVVTAGEQGFLVPVDDVSATSIMLEKILSDSEIRYRLADNGIANANDYDWKDIASQYAKLYLSS